MIVGFNPMRDRSFRDDRQSQQPVAPAHDRGHDGAPLYGKGSEGLSRHVRNFAVFLGRSPDAASAENVRLYQLHMAKQLIGAPTINAAVAALRFSSTSRPHIAREHWTEGKVH
jgi:hypothetical protein